MPVKPQHLNQLFGGNKEIYSQFGLEGHNGIDIKAEHGTPVYAAHDGICYPGVDPNEGNGVVIRTIEAFDYGEQEVHFKTIYWHFIKADAVVRTGQFVRAGELIGYADSTGFSTGDHLHFGLKPQAWDEENWTWYNVEQKNGYAGAIDPIPYFNNFYAEDAQTVFGLFRLLLPLLKKIAGL